MQRRVQRVFDRILTTIEARLSKADVPLPGFILAFLDDEPWWADWRETLAREITEGLLPAARGGASSAAAQLGIKQSWWRLLPQVEQWAANHAAALVRTVEESVKPTLRQAIVDGLQEGLPWRDVRARIMRETGLTDWRAGRIARTEIIRAHSQGAVEGYTASGTVRGLRWLDGQIGACPKCRALHNKTVKVGEPFYTDPKFGDGLPPRHPNCRCSVAPVTLDHIKRLPETHPLRDNRRGSIAELTDRETFTEINGVRLTGERRAHYRYRHSDQFDVDQAEGMLENLLKNPDGIKIHRGAQVGFTDWSERNYLISVVDKGELRSMYIKKKKTVNKWPDA